MSITRYDASMEDTRLVEAATSSGRECQSLLDLLQSFQNQPRMARDLKEELVSLEEILAIAVGSIRSSSLYDYTQLDAPFRRCGSVCRELANDVRQLAPKQSNGNLEWAKLRYMDGDIRGFHATLAGYKQTIAIVLAGSNLKSELSRTSPSRYPWDVRLTLP